MSEKIKKLNIKCLLVLIFKNVNILYILTLANTMLNTLLNLRKCHLKPIYFSLNHCTMKMYLGTFTKTMC